MKFKNGLYALLLGIISLVSSSDSLLPQETKTNPIQYTEAYKFHTSIGTNSDILDSESFKHARKTVNGYHWNNSVAEYSRNYIGKDFVYIDTGKLIVKQYETKAEAIEHENLEQGNLVLETIILQNRNNNDIKKVRLIRVSKNQRDIIDLVNKKGPYTTVIKFQENNGVKIYDPDPKDIPDTVALQPYIVFFEIYSRKPQY
jgi:hypothetical protein